MKYTLTFLAGLIVGVALARWLYRTPPKTGEWPKAITSDGDVIEGWDDALFHQQVIAVNSGQPLPPTVFERIRSIYRECRARLTWPKDKQ